jgi:hypothetical protein
MYDNLIEQIAWLLNLHWNQVYSWIALRHVLYSIPDYRAKVLITMIDNRISAEKF